MSAGQTAVLCGREDNRGSDVALAMRHRLCGISNYELNGLWKEDEHPAYNHSKEYGTRCLFKGATGVVMLKVKLPSAA